MITTGQMYWLTMLDSIKGFLFFLSALSAVATILLAAVAFALATKIREFSATPKEDIDAAHELGYKMLKFVTPPLMVLTLVLFLVTTLTPSTKQMAAILVVPRIANSEKVQMAGNKLYDLACAWMDELSPSKTMAKEKEESR